MPAGPGAAVTALSESYAKAHNLKLLPVSYVEAGTSAFRGQQRREGSKLHALLAAVKAGRIPSSTWLLVEQIDRLSRENVLKALDSFRALLTEGLTIVTLTDSRVYTRASLEENFTDLLIFLTIAARANEESVSKARRLTAAWQQKRKQAVERKIPLTGRCPAWLRLSNGEYSVIPARAKTVQRIFTLTAQGRGSHALARLLNSTHVPPIEDRQHQRPPAAGTPRVAPVPVT
jgi:DNA invertase Pin-like site-specific DNA recombinase